jgi:outer membrane protein assembly factor BamB
MNRIHRPKTQLWALAGSALLFIALNTPATRGQDASTGLSTPSELAGSWIATLSHGGERRPFGLAFEQQADGGFLVKMSNPSTQIWDAPIAKATLEGGKVHIGESITFDLDPAAGTLSGMMPKILVPVYTMSVVFHRGTLEHPARVELTAPIAKPAWTFAAGAPVWADALYDRGVVYIGADDGRLHALVARTGKELWVFKARGAIRSSAARAGNDLLLQADDGFLYWLDRTLGTERLKVRLCEKPIERLPPTNEKSRFDRFASGVTIANGRLYAGTHEGHVLALNPADGKRLWDFASGDSVLSTPVITAGRLYFGSFDGNVYAVDAASGTLLWKHDTGAPVVSTPALHEGRVIVGSRSYDLLALDGRTGATVWSRYIWFSWVESPATIRETTAYVGSSDAARLYALDAGTGKSAWELDVHGWAWGHPAVTDRRVFIGTSATPQYVVGHDAAFVAVDRPSGKVAWRFPIPAPTDQSTYGFAASAAVGEGLVFAGAVDGTVYAFPQ